MLWAIKIRRDHEAGMRGRALHGSSAPHLRLSAPLHRHRDLDVAHGAHERSHRIDGEEFYRPLDGVMIDDTKLFNDKLAEWENSCNYHRPHGGLGGQTPYERLRRRRRPQFNDLRQLHKPLRRNR